MFCSFLIKKSILTQAACKVKSHSYLTLHTERHLTVGSRNIHVSDLCTTVSSQPHSAGANAVLKENIMGPHVLSALDNDVRLPEVITILLTFLVIY